MTVTADPRPVVVTTEHRGVFFGFLNGPDDTSIVVLTDAQMCVYWSADVRGVLGLASSGPSQASRVTAPVARIVVQAVTAVMDASEDAVAAWQTRPWG